MTFCLRHYIKRYQQRLWRIITWMGGITVNILLVDQQWCVGKKVVVLVKVHIKNMIVTVAQCCRLHACVCFACCQTECANSVDSPVVVPGGRMRTKPLIPEMCFTTTTDEDSECEQQPVTPHLEEDGTSLLISCSQCSVRVHTSEYTNI